MRSGVKLAFLLLVGAMLFSGCVYAKNDIQQFTKLEVSDAENNLITTIEDESTLSDFADKISLQDWKSVEFPQGLKQGNSFTVYKNSSAKNNNDLEKIMTVTTYLDSNYVNIQVVPDVVKNLKLSESMTSINTEFPVDTMEFLNNISE